MNQEELKEILKYDPETGSFTWVKTTGPRSKKGSVIPTGAKYVAINKVTYTVTKLIFLYMTGETPNGYIYRHNKDVNDNSWDNLYLTQGRDNELTQEGLKKLVTYDKDTGLFFNTKGKQIGHVCPKGYVLASIKGKQRRLHQMAWLYTNGYTPTSPYELDHINRNKTDNRLFNLREITHQENCTNGSVRVNSTSGVTGVNFHKGSNKWIAHISIGGQKKQLIATADFNEAVKARKTAELKYYT